MMASHCPEAQGKSIKRAVLTESLLQCGRGPEYSGSLPDRADSSSWRGAQLVRRRGSFALSGSAKPSRNNARIVGGKERWSAAQVQPSWDSSSA